MGSPERCSLLTMFCLAKILRRADRWQEQTCRSRSRVVGAVAMGSCRGAGEADTRTTVIAVLVSGAEGGSAPSEEVRGYASPAPSCWSLLYTSRTVPGAGARTSTHHDSPPCHPAVTSARNESKYDMSTLTTLLGAHSSLKNHRTATSIRIIGDSNMKVSRIIHHFALRRVMRGA